LTLSNGIKINKNDMVAPYIDACLWDGEVYENPKKFNPHRWLTDDEVLLQKMEKSMLAFGYGPRICPGFLYLFIIFLFIFIFLFDEK
jgi:cytochrome P450